MSYNNGYNNYRREHRINEDDVPESKHTIFIRGLPGSMSTDEIKDYFEDKIGPVSFDFVKTSPDNARLFIAVRFESREDAKSAMAMFSSRDILNHRCDLSWFKDIRRFAQYQQSMGVPFRGGRGRGTFRGRGSYRGGGYGNRDYDRDNRRRDSDRDRDRSSRSRSKSRSRSPRSRSHSRSSKRSSSRDRSRSRSSVDRSRSRSLRRSRSRSAKRSDNESRSRRRSTSRDSAASVESKESRKRRNKKKRRRSRRSPSHSAVSSDEGEIHSDADRKNRSGNIPSDPKDRSGSAMDMSSRENSPIPPPAPIPPPTVTPTIKVNLKTTREDLEIPVPPPAPVPPVAATMVDVQKTSFSIGMDTDEPKIVRKTESLEHVIYTGEPPQQPPPVPAPEKRTNLPPPPHPPAMVSSETSLVGSRFRPAEMSFEGEPTCKKERFEEQQPTPQTSDYGMRSNPYNSWTPVEKQNDSKPNGFGYNQPAAAYAPKDESARFPVLSKAFAEIRDFQQQLIRGVKAEPKEESFGLTLSSLSNEEEDEMRKKQAREQRLATMDEIEQERFYVQKRKLENAFKNDCNTYAIVIRKLLTKDSSLERPLRMALIETMEDLEKQMMEKIDSFLQIY